MTVVLFDVDNTLLDNDAAKAELASRLERSLDPDDVDRFWQLYEEVRSEIGMVSFPLTLERFLPVHCTDPIAPQRAAEAILGLDYREFLRPGALELLAELDRLATPLILSNGDQLFQRWKIRQAGLAAAVDQKVWVFAEKEHHLEDLDRRFGPDARFVLVEDKGRALRAAAQHWGDRVKTVFMDFGHHAADDPHRADLVVTSPAELHDRLDELGISPAGSVGPAAAPTP